MTDKDPNSIDSILERLKDANEKYQMWDVLAVPNEMPGDQALVKKGFNDFYHQPKKKE